MYSYKDAENNYNEFMMNYLSTTNYYHPKFFKCRNPNHADNKPSMKFNPKNNKVHCFSCGVTYGLVDLVMIDNKLTYPEALNYVRVNLLHEKPIASKITTQICDYTHFYETLELDYTYTQKRNINDYIARRFGVRYNKANNSIIIANGANSYTERFIDGDVRYKHYGKLELFNKTQPVNADKPTIVVEGEIDCLSVYEAIGFKEGVKIKDLPCNCLALGSANNWHKLVASGIDNLIIALDNDDAGITATEQLTDALIKKGIKFKVVNLYDTYKDANEILVKDLKLFKENIKNVL
jgi:DNA primase